MLLSYGNKESEQDAMVASWSFIQWLYEFWFESCSGMTMFYYVPNHLLNGISITGNMSEIEQTKKMEII